MGYSGRSWSRSRSAGHTVRHSGGIDLVQSEFSYTLGADIENLLLTKGGTGTGNGLDNNMQSLDSTVYPLQARPGS